GLGLALVKVLVEMHGGTVVAASDGVDRGAVFTITLPLHVTAPSQTKTPATPAGPAARRVLIIEDNIDAANSLRDALQIAGHDVEVTYSGPEALEKARTFAPDVVICDIGLPEMDGYEVAQKLRAEQPGGPMILVSLSGYAGVDDIRKAK